MLPPESEPTLNDTTMVAGFLSAEVNHELTQTLNFLRYLISQSQADAESEIGGFAQTEIERLSRLVSHLRAFKLRSPSLTEGTLATLLAHCVAKVEATLGQLSQEVLVTEVPRNIQVQVDVEYFEGAIVALLQHAIHNTPTGVGITIRAFSLKTPAPQKACIEIADSGPALLAPHHAPGLFDIWGMESVGSPAHLRAVAQRLLRALGGALSYERSDDKNIFSIAIPAVIGEQS